jgi:raffinose/stachyose/melibiose transport system permease protein
VSGLRTLLLGWFNLAWIAAIFALPFLFVLLQAAKSQAEAARLDFSWPTDWQLAENFRAVIAAGDYELILAFFNSTVITVGGVAGLVVLAAMVGYILQRRPSPMTRRIDFLILAGLMMPPAVVPTIWLLQETGLFATLHGMVLIQIAYNFSFSVLIYKAFLATVPRHLDEAARIDGATPLQTFFRVVLPLLKPVTVTNIVVQSIQIFNDFTNPLYYLPGRENVTVQLTLYNFQSQYLTQYNLLFMNILLVTIPPLILFVFFNRKIVEGMTAGAVKG